MPIPAAAQPLTGTEPIRRGAAETDSGYAPEKSCSWLIRAAARRGRAAVSAAPRKASPAFRLRLSVYRSADKARTWSDGLSREACSSGCGGFPRSRLAVPARRCFRCAAVGSCGTVPLRERRACACLCIAAAFFVLGFRAAYEEQHLCAADFLRTMRRRSERRGLSAACANRRRLGVHRPFFRRRAELERPCLNARTAARLGIRRKRLGGISRAAAEERGNVSSAADSSLLRSASKAARASRSPPRRPLCAAALLNAAIPY